MKTNRPIKTNYYGPGRAKVISKTTSSIHAEKAVPNAVYHLSQNHYAASVAEVFDNETGELHAVITHSASGSIHIVFKRDPVVPVCVVIPTRSKK